LGHLLIPFEAAAMKRYAVSLAVNDVQNDTAQCIEEVPEFRSAQAALF
jgi:putative SOS response-associated peptidase YedK